MNPFSTIGVRPRFELDKSELDRRYRDLLRVLHPDRFARSTTTERRLSLGRAVEVNEAYRVLRDDIRRAEALLAMHGRDTEGSAQHEEDPEFLMQVMELREALAGARAANDSERVRELASEVEQKQGAVRSEMAARFSRLEGRAGEQALAPIVRLLGRMRYFRRFLDEVAAVEHEALEA